MPYFQFMSNTRSHTVVHTQITFISCDTLPPNPLLVLTGFHFLSAGVKFSDWEPKDEECKKCFKGGGLLTEIPFHTGVHLSRNYCWFNHVLLQPKEFSVSLQVHLRHNKTLLCKITWKPLSCYAWLSIVTFVAPCEVTLKILLIVLYSINIL